MAFDLPPPKPGVEITLATKGMSKGITQTKGPQAVAKGFVRFGGLQVGAQWKNVSSPNANGEASIFANVSRKVAAVQLTAGISYKMHTRVRDERDSRAFEFTGSAIRKFGPVSAKLNAIFSPDDLGTTGRTLFVEAGPSLALGHGWSLSGAAGFRQRSGGADYTPFNAGVGKALGRLQFDLRYYDTDQSGLGSPYRGRIVGSAKLSF
jgi:uncharacterized protein (TIGR02001 family)